MNIKIKIDDWGKITNKTFTDKNTALGFLYHLGGVKVTFDGKEYDLVEDMPDWGKIISSYLDKVTCSTECYICLKELPLDTTIPVVDQVQQITLSIIDKRDIKKAEIGNNLCQDCFNDLIRIAGGFSLDFSTISNMKNGKKGKGKSKVRGDSEYYRRIAQKGRENKKARSQG